MENEYARQMSEILPFSSTTVVSRLLAIDTYGLFELIQTSKYLYPAFDLIR